MHLIGSFLSVVQVKIGASFAADQKEGLGILIQNGSDLFRRGRSRGTAPVGAVLFTAVAAFQVNPFRNDNFIGFEG